MINDDLSKKKNQYWSERPYTRTVILEISFSAFYKLLIVITGSVSQYIFILEIYYKLLIFINSSLTKISELQ